MTVDDRVGLGPTLEQAWPHHFRVLARGPLEAFLEGPACRDLRAQMETADRPAPMRIDHAPEP